MQRVRLAVAVVMAAAAISAVAVGWLAEVPEITAEEAAAVTEDALGAAGLSAVVDPRPTASAYASPSRPAVEVWTVRATVRSAPIAVLLARSGAQPVSIDDRRANGTGYVLSELEFSAVAGRVDDPALARLVRRNVTLTVAAVGVVAMALALAFVTVQHRPQEPR